MTAAWARRGATQSPTRCTGGGPVNRTDILATYLYQKGFQVLDFGMASTLAVVVLCNLPNRDCAANASAGELAVEANGEARYRTEFVDPIAEQFASHPEQLMVAIIEPDSLANLTTNQLVPKCAARLRWQA